MKLEDILAGVPVLDKAGDPSLEISDISYSSRTVAPGHLFAALKGEKTDGNLYIQDALTRGAAAVLTENRYSGEAAAGWIQVADAREAMALCSANLFRHPSRELTVIAVTGTKGKTTVTYLMEAILKRAGKRPGVLGTITYRGPGLEKTADRTTPEAPDLQRMMRIMRDNGGTHCVMEISSHSLELHRAKGTSVDVAVFTNLSGEHLDYHKNMESYFAAKRKLFSLSPGSMAVVNLDDPWGRRLVKELPGGAITFGTAPDAMVRAEQVGFTGAGIEMLLVYPAGRIRLSSPLLGKPNVYNILTAAAAALTLNLSETALHDGIADVKEVRGRFEKIENRKGLHIFVDYAHTDDALRNLLETARELAGSARMILAVGAGGDRDRSKRPRMGEAAGRLADWTIITTDNPRSEDPPAIISEVEAGVRKFGAEKYEIEPDRRTAIRKALNRADKGDYVLIAGKGHETYQIIGDTVQHFDDAEVIRELLEEGEES